VVEARAAHGAKIRGPARASNSQVALLAVSGRPLRSRKVASDWTAWSKLRNRTADRAAPKAMAQSPTLPTLPSRTSIRILVVEDDATGRLGMGRLLEQGGYTLDSAQDAISALRVAGEHTPDVVITDLVKPDMDGVELLTKLKQKDSGLPVIVVTASGDVGSAVAAMRAGAEDYLSKPIDVGELELAVERALERRDLRVEAENMRRQILVQNERLRKLYEISKQLTRFETIARTVPKFLALLSESVPLSTAILMVEQGTPTGNRTRAIAWHAEGVSTSQLREAKLHAKTAYDYLIRRSSHVEEEPGANWLPSTFSPPSGARKSGFVLLPLVVEHHQVFGALQVEGAVGLDEAALTFVNAAVNQLAIALDRAAAIDSKQAAAKAELRDAEFLSGASATLFSSLEYEKTIAAVVRAAVPPFADMCFLDRVGEDGRLHRIAINVADPGGGRADRVRPSEPPSDPKGPEVQALRSGRSLLLTDLDTTGHEAASTGAFGNGGFHSRMVVPLVARGRERGVLTFVAAESAHPYSASDLTLAEEIGHRAAIAIDNAELYEQAQRAVRARQDLLAIVSHDLKNPLSAILIATKVLTNASPTEGPAARKKRIDTIERSAHRMHRLLEDLLDIASIEAGRLAMEMQCHSVGPLVSEAVELHGSAALEKQLRLECVLSDPKLEVNCDRGRILQVFGNLIGNAIKFTRKGGSITVAAAPRDEAMLFSVADSGPGIEPAELAHVFDRFWQARKTARLGTGLGLAIAKALVEAHGGRIWVESKLGHGATFFFTIPWVATRVRSVPGDLSNGPGPPITIETDRGFTPSPTS
jgi:signal transduction histidine kinase/DNA-binding response OmpR family regulator